MSTPSKNTRLAIAKKQALLLEDAATTPSVNEGADLTTPPSKNTRLAVKRLGGKKQVLLLEDAAMTPKAKEEETTEAGTQTAIVAANSGSEWIKKKFAAQDKQNKKVTAQFKTQGEKINSQGQHIATLQGKQDAVVGTVQGMGDSLIQAWQTIRVLSVTSGGLLRLLHARTQAYRNFASTAAFFATFLAAILGYYLLATTFLAITLGFYFTKNLYKK